MFTVAPFCFVYIFFFFLPYSDFRLVTWGLSRPDTARPTLCFINCIIPQASEQSCSSGSQDGWCVKQKSQCQGEVTSDSQNCPLGFVCCRGESGNCLACSSLCSSYFLSLLSYHIFPCSTWSSRPKLRQLCSFFFLFNSLVCMQGNIRNDNRKIWKFMLWPHKNKWKKASLAWVICITGQFKGSNSIAVTLTVSYGLEKSVS